MRRLQYMRHRGRIALCMACVGLPLWVVGPASAGEWRITPSLTVRETYTDNVELDPPGEERSSFVHEARAGLSLRGEGRRLQTNVDYAYQFLEYTRGDEEADGFHRLSARATLEAIEDFLFVDATAGVSQRNTTASGRRGVDTISRTGNTENVYTYQVQPYFRQRLGSYADALVRIESSDFRNDSVRGESTASDSTSQGFTVDLSSGREFDVLPWTLQYSRRTIDFDDEEENTEFESLRGTARYRLNRRFEPFLSMSYEDNDFRTQEEDRLSGLTWRGGVVWTPSSRTTVEVGYGDELFGESYFLDVSHQRRRSVFEATYRERFTTQRDLILERVVVPVVDEFGEPVDDPLTGQPLLLPLDVLRETNETFVNRSFRGSYALRMKRGAFRLAVNRDRRSFEVSGDSETTYGLDVSLDRSLSRKSSATLSSRWQWNEDEAAQGDDRIWDVRLRYSYRLSESLTGSVTVLRAENDGDAAENSYEENRIVADLTVSF